MAVEQFELPKITVRTWRFPCATVRAIRDKYMTLSNEQYWALTEAGNSCVGDDGYVSGPEFMVPGSTCAGGVMSKALIGQLVMCSLFRPTTHCAKVKFFTVPWEDNPYSSRTLDEALDVADRLARNVGAVVIRAVDAATRGDDEVPCTLSAADKDELSAYIAATPV